MFTTLDEEQSYFSHHTVYPVDLLTFESESTLKHNLCQVLQKLRAFSPTSHEELKRLTKLLTHIQNSQIVFTYTEP